MADYYSPTQRPFTGQTLDDNYYAQTGWDPRLQSVYNVLMGVSGPGYYDGTGPISRNQFGTEAQGDNQNSGVAGPGNLDQNQAFLDYLTQRYGTTDVATRDVRQDGGPQDQWDQVVYRNDGSGSGYLPTDDKVHQVNDSSITPYLIALAAGGAWTGLGTALGGAAAGGTAGSAGAAGGAGAASGAATGGAGWLTEAQIAALADAGASGGGISGLGAGALGGSAVTLPPVTISAPAIASGGGASLPEILGGTAAVGGGAQAANSVFNQAQDSQAASQQQGYAPNSMSSPNANQLGGGYGAAESGITKQPGVLDSLGNLFSGNGSLGQVGSALSTGVSNMNLTDWAKLATLAAGAAAGSQTQGGATQTTQQLIDPRFAAYLYGTGTGDTNSLLGAANANWQANKSGINDTMRAGLDAQKALYTNGSPAAQVGSVAQGLLGGTVAGNPFTTGQASLQAQGLLSPQRRRAGINGLISY